MMIYSSRRRQIFLYTPIDWFITTVIRHQIAGWRFIRSNPQGAEYLLISLWILIVLTGAVIGFGIQEGNL